MRNFNLDDYDLIIYDYYDNFICCLNNIDEATILFNIPKKELYRIIRKKRFFVYKNKLVKIYLYKKIKNFKIKEVRVCTR